jgi:Peptidase M15
MRIYLTPDDIITSSQHYPERAKSGELTGTVRQNISDLCLAVNHLFNDLNYQGFLTVTSGFRTSGANVSIPNAAKRSNHLIGKAVDLSDVTGELDVLLSNPSTDRLLKLHGLWLENPNNTRFWAHLDTKDRGLRKKNIFNP